MRLFWMQGVLSANEAHLCAIDDNGAVASVCGHVWLQQPTRSEPETTRCPDCEKINASGQEIAAEDAQGRRVIVRAKCDPAHVGSLDPFDDIVAQLKKLRVAYSLTVAMQGAKSTPRYWSNVAEFGHAAIDAFGQVAEEIRQKAHQALDAQSDI